MLLKNERCYKSVCKELSNKVLYQRGYIDSYCEKMVLIYKNLEYIVTYFQKEKDFFLKNCYFRLSIEEAS